MSNAHVEDNSDFAALPLAEVSFFNFFTNNRETSFTLLKTFRTISSLRAVSTTKLMLWQQQCVYATFLQTSLIRYQPVKKRFNFISGIPY